ncbi:3,4-dihydroxy-2-butanone-4-phosphate synthase, partial [Staphylococcus hominis]|uniref:3,4-dihydroxy-2-butanone-4-phosphate synthase n=1 Tax=Staphylococcus hominis TaxID=1290 RepID=UPI0028D3F41F
MQTLLQIATQHPPLAPKLTPPPPARVICEIINDDRTMPKRNQLQQFKQPHQLKIITIQTLINYPRKQQNQR